MRRFIILLCLLVASTGCSQRDSNLIPVGRDNEGYEHAIRKDSIKWSGDEVDFVVVRTKSHKVGEGEQRALGVRLAMSKKTATINEMNNYGTFVVTYGKEGPIPSGSMAEAYYQALKE